MRIISTLKPAKIACININCHGHSVKGRPRNFCEDFYGGGSTPKPPSEYGSELHHQKWRKLRVTQPVKCQQKKHARVIFGMQF